MKFFKISLIILVMLLIVMPIFASAQRGGGSGASNEVDTPEEVLTVIDRIANWMFTIFLSVAVIMIIYGAFVYLTSGGGENTSKAHKILIYSAVAIAVAFLSKGIVKIVESIVQP